jgi:hypothetical protein
MSSFPVFGRICVVYNFYFSVMFFFKVWTPFMARCTRCNTNFAKLWIQINTMQVRGYLVITIGYSVVYLGMWTLSVTCCMSAVVCRGVYSMCYLRQHGGYLSVTWGRLAVVCKSVCVLFQKIEAGWWLSVSYMRQDDGYLSVTWGRMKDICQLHKAALSLYVS